MTDGLLHRDRDGKLADGAGLLAPHVDLLADGERRRLDEVARVGEFSIISRGFNPVEKLEPRLLRALAVVGTSYVALGSTDGIRGVEDLDGRLEAFLDHHGWAAVIVRPDFYIYGGAADATALENLVRDLLTHLRNAGVSLPTADEPLARDGTGVIENRVAARGPL
jgi:hypothetical protein